MGLIGPQQPKQLELFALAFEKIAIFHIIFPVASTNVNQLVPNLIK